jgi:hypothetical protein
MVQMYPDRNAGNHGSRQTCCRYPPHRLTTNCRTSRAYADNAFLYAPNIYDGAGMVSGAVSHEERDQRVISSFREPLNVPLVSV